MIRPVVLQKCCPNAALGVRLQTRRRFTAPSSLTGDSSAQQLNPAAPPTMTRIRVVHRVFAVRNSSTAAAAEHDSGTISSRPGPTRDDSSDHAGEETLDFFRIFDLPYEFAVDEQNLREKYRNFMKDLHPDQQQQREQQNHLPSAACDSSTTASNNSSSSHTPTASSVTRAYDSLKRPHVRATHLLKILGHPLEEEATTTTQQPQTQLVGACFLMDVMMHREEIDDARHDQNELKRLFDQNAARIADCCRQLEASFASRDFSAARTCTAQLQYWNRIDETLRDALDSLE